MTNYLTCEKRKGKRISEEVCHKKCQDKGECAAFQKLTAPAVQAEDVEKEEEEPNAQEQEGDDNHVLILAMDVEGEIIERPLAIPSVGKAQQLYQQVLSLKAEIEVRWFELGKILQEMFECRHYIDLGYTIWKDFCEVALGPLGLGWRAIDYLRMTRKKCDEVGIGREIAGEIGWSRLKEIIPVVTRKNRDHWIDVARRKETTVQVLNAKVRVARGKVTEEESKIIPEKMLFALFKEQKEIVELALDVASKVAASDKNGFLLADVICPSFLAEYPVGAEVGKRPEMIARLLGRFEVAFKVKFAGEVTDLETGEILVESRE